MRAGMRALALLIGLAAGLAPALQLSAQPAAVPHVKARHKPGPVTIRGVAVHVTAHGFTLQTTTHGSYAVAITAATGVDQKGKSGRATLHEGDHVGVRGFVSGRQISAIHVRIYPSKSAGPKPFSFRGTVSRVQGADILIASGGKSVWVHVTGATTITIGSQQGTAGRVGAGDHVEVRVQQSGGRLNVLHLHIYSRRLPSRHVEVRGTLTSVSDGGITVASGKDNYRIALSSQTLIYLGANPGTRQSLKVGQSVTVHACCLGRPLSASSVHIRKSPSGAHVDVRGTVTSLSSSGLSVTSGSQRYQIALSSHTRVYVGNSGASRTVLKVGQSVTVHACCVGQTLTATSIHVRKTATKRVTVELRGQVTSIDARGIRITASGHETSVSLQSSTAYDLGSSSTSRGEVRVGDEVSIRAYRSGSTLTAIRVHIYPEFRRQRTVDGQVVAVSSSGLVIEARGKRYTVATQPDTAVSVNGKRAQLASLRVGDRVRAIGRVDPSNRMTAASVSVRRAPPRKVTVSGTVTQASGGALVVVDGFGRRYPVRLAPHARVQLHGKPAPAAALFPGVKATVHGTMSGSTLVATSVTLDVRARSVQGRVESVAPSRITLRLSSGTAVSVDFPGGVRVEDSARHGGHASVQAGAFIKVEGYEEPSGAVRAVTAQVLHPQLSVSATVTSSKPFTVQTSRGDRYRLRFSSASQITAARVGLALVPGDIPVGARVRVQGTVQSDGTLAVDQLEAQLTSVTLAGKVTALAAQGCTVDAGAGAVQVQTNADTVVAQGQRAVTLADVVVGDEVTVYGYRAATAILARKIVLHRRLLALDGVVQSVDPAGFSVTAQDGVHRVLLDSTTIVTGGASTDIVVGAQVHVTGYLRGDGVILATRVRLGKKHRTA